MHPDRSQPRVARSTRPEPAERPRASAQHDNRPQAKQPFARSCLLLRFQMMSRVLGNRDELRIRAWSKFVGESARRFKRLTTLRSIERLLRQRVAHIARQLLAHDRK